MIAAGTATAAPGSGAAILMPSDPVAAGSYGTWVIDYTAAEQFDSGGGTVVVTIPPGWSDPSAGLPVVPGHVEVSGPPGVVDSLVVRGREIWIYAGASPGRLQAGDHLYLSYGTPAPAGSAQAQTTAPATVTFEVASDPHGSSPVPISSGSPSVAVIAGPPLNLVWEPASLDLIAGVPLPVRLESRDGQGNPSPVAADQLLSLTATSGTLRVLDGGAPVSEVVLPADSSGVWLEVSETRAGSGWTLRAADGDGVPPSLAAAVAAVSAQAGSAARLEVRGILDPVVAGERTSVTVEALDAHGNRAADYLGTVGFSSSDSGSATELPADYTFTASDGGLHVFAGEVRLTTAGEQSVRAEDRAAPGISGEQAGIEVLAADAAALIVSDIDDPVVSGVASDVVVTARDPFGNLAAGYLGTIGFATDDPHPGARVPPDYAFSAADSGRHRFPEGVVLVTSGLSTVSASDLAAPLAGAQTDIDVLPGPAAIAVLIPGDQVPVTVGASQSIVLAVSDAAGNPVASEPAAIAILDAPDGALAPDPAHPGGTEGNATVQSGLTDAAGRLSVFYVAPAEAGLADTLDAWTALVPAAAIDELVAVSVAAGATRLAIGPQGAIADTAFASIPLVIDAEDSFGNPDPGASPLVRLTASSPTARFSIDGGATWSAAASDSLVLAAGTSGNTLRVRDATAGQLAVSASDAAGFLAPASRNDLTILPALAAGTIGLAVTPDTLTADGESEAVVDGGPVTDRHGNPVADLLVTVAIDPGQVVAVDESPAPGIQRRTDAAGQFAFSVRAADFPAVAQVSAESGPGPGTGTAAGEGVLVFDRRVELEAVSLSPWSAVPGDTVGFQVVMLNRGPVAATVGGGTVIQFAVPGGASFASILASPAQVQAGETQAIQFAAERIDPGFVPGRYTPFIRLRGSDARGAEIDTLVSCPHESFALEALAITAVAAPVQVSRGQTGVEVVVVARNLGDQALPVTAVGLDFSEPAYTLRGVDPPLPHLLAARSEFAYRVTVDVDPLATLGSVRIDAEVGFEAGGGPRVVRGAAVAAIWTVGTAADLVYVAGSIAPRRVSAGQTHPASVVVENLGGAPVVLDPAQTELVWIRPGNDLVTPLAAATVVPGLGRVAVPFSDLAVPAGYASGRLAARLVAAGTENGAPYSRALTISDSLLIEQPAVLAVVAGSVAPDSVSLGQTRSFSLSIANTGEAAITLLEGSRLRLAGGVTVELPLAGPPLDLPGGSQAAADFTARFLDPALGSGLVPVTIEAVTRENDVNGSASLNVPEPLVTEGPAILRWVAGSLSPRRVTRGEEASFALVLANDGQAAITVGAGSEFVVSDGAHELRITYPGPPVILAGGGTASLALPVSTVPALLAAQDYAPVLHLVAVEHGQASAPAVAAPAAELTVEAPADLRYVPGSIDPAVVAAGQTAGFRIVVENRGGAAARPAAETELTLGGLSLAIDLLRSPAEIHGGAIDTLYFGPDLLVSVGAGVHAPVVGFTGTDWNGTPLSFSIDLAPDTITIVRGAALRATGLESRAPRAARVNRGQTVTFWLAVANPGEEAVTGTVATLGGTGLAGPLAVPLGTIAGGDTAAVEVEAVAASALGPALVTATLDGGTGVISGNPATLLPALDDTLALDIEHEASLAAAVWISGPAGALDGVTSSGSLLDLEVRVENRGQAPIGEGGSLELMVPAGYGILGPAEQGFAADVPIPFAVAVPPGAAPPDSFVVVLADLPPDLNSGAPAQVTAPRSAAAIEAVEAARLELAAAIVEPATAVEGVAFPGQTVTVEAVVENTGTAAAPGLGEIELVLGSAELALAPGEVARREFTVGEAIRFRVVAAARSGPPHPLTVRLVNVPADENTGLPAAVSRPEVTLGLATRVAAGEVAGGAPDVTAAPMVRGGSPVPVLVLAITNPAPAAPEMAIILDRIAPRLTRLAPADGGSATAVTGQAALEEVAGRLELRRDRADGALAAEWSGMGAPELAVGDTLEGQETRNYVLLLAPSVQATAGIYRLELGSAGTITFEDAASGEPLPLELSAGDVESAPFTLYEGLLAAPNPFAPAREAASITYVLAEDAAVEIEIFTLLGDRVWSRSLAAGEAGGRTGLNRVPWDGRNASGEPVRNGVYHCRVRGGGLDAMVKIAAIR